MNAADGKRLQEVRKLPCVGCGRSAPSQAAHSNFGEHGKGMAKKAADIFTIPLCYKCHCWFDQYQVMNREESKTWFNEKLREANRMLISVEEIY